METSLRLGDSLQEENEQLRKCCAQQTGAHRMDYGSIAFLFSYLRKRPDTYRQKEIHSTGLNPILVHLAPNPAGGLFATEMITQGACIHTKIPKLVGWRKNILPIAYTVEVFEVMKIFKQPFCNITFVEQQKKKSASSLNPCRHRTFMSLF